MVIPQDFINMIAQMLPEEHERLVSAFQSSPQVSIRLNPLYPESREMVVDSLGCDIDGSVPWASQAYYLKQRPQFIADPLLHQGLYYVQDASSMFLEQAIRQSVSAPVKALDLCAAPGGKSTLMASTLPAGSLLVCNEIQRSRARILAENIAKWGNAHTMVTCNTPAQIGASGILFDMIAVDAPCSGEGMFRKDEGAIADWSLDNVRMCAERQRSIIEDIWPVLKPGGFLIYSTCTFNTTENEDNVQWIMDRFGAQAIPIETKPEWNILGALQNRDLPVYHFMQHRTRGEGFFISLLQKPDDKAILLRDKPIKEQPLKSPQHCKEWIMPSSDYLFMERDNTLYAMPQQHAHDMACIHQELYALIPGIEIATLKGHDWVPCQALAMSEALNRQAFHSIEVSREVALAYLHCEALRLDCSERGIMLLTYKNIPLGFVKNIGNRANNMYPGEWRIRTLLS